MVGEECGMKDILTQFELQARLRAIFATLHLRKGAPLLIHGDPRQ